MVPVRIAHLRRLTLIMRVMRKALHILLLTLAPLLGAAQPVAEPGKTLTGQLLRPPAWSEKTREKLELDLEIARAVFEVAPDREDSWIWLGRRLGYLGRYAEAIDVFTEGLQKFPGSYKLHRFRGRHRARNRDFAGAIADYQDGLEKMQGHPDSFEPDGLPNSRGLTISTYRSNLHYYLGQTSFATGDYRRMITQLDLSAESPIALDIPDHRLAVVFWQYLAHMKLGEVELAESLLRSVPAELQLIENETYHQAIKVLQRATPPQLAETDGDSLSRFALGMRLEFDGDRPGSNRVLGELVSDSALGYWPAEVELARRSRQ